MKRRYGAAAGQAMPLVVLGAVMLCGMMSVGVDVGLTVSKQHMLRNAADNAASAGQQIMQETSGISGTAVWNAMVSTLSSAGLAVQNVDGSSSAVSDPCAAGYSGNQVAMTAIYVDANGLGIPGISGTVTLTNSAPPTNAMGVQVNLAGCQPAVFGRVIGHGSYGVGAGSSSGGPLQGPTSTASATPTPGGPTVTPTATNTWAPGTTPTDTATPLPTNTPVPLDTNTPVPLATDTPTPPQIAGADTATLTNTPVPAATSTPTSTATNTPLPGATSTPTSCGPTNTPVPLHTNTPVPVITNTPVPAITNTPVPAHTNTPVPVVTNTPVPSTGGDVIVLDSDGDSHSKIMYVSGGSVTTNVLDVNGTNPNALWMDSGSISASTINVQGGVKRQGGTISTYNTSQPQTADPYGALATPTVPAATCSSSVTTACPDGTNFNNGTYRLTPGHYTVTLNMNSGATICLAPGFYYVDASWNVNNATILPYGTGACAGYSAAGSGFTFYFRAGGLQLNSGGDFTHFTAQQSGPYAGILYWQDKSNTTANATDFKFAGGGWYMPGADLTMNSGSQFTPTWLIASDLTVDSGATLSTGPATPNTPVPVTTNTPVPALTNTPVPALTNTPVPVLTNTPVPLTAPTNTPVPLYCALTTPTPTSTSAPLATSTPTPTPTNTATAMPTSTITPTPTNTGTATPLPTNTPVPNTAATNTPVPLPTNTPSPTTTPVGVGEPYAISGAPRGDCSAGSNVPAPGASDSGDEFYCTGVYHIGDTVTAYANGRGLGNNYGHDSSFKGYIGDSSYYLGTTGLDQETSQNTGHGNNAPGSCPAYMKLPIISGIEHSGAYEYFVPLELVVIHVTQCGDPTTGTIMYTVPSPDPLGIVQ